MAAQGDDGSVGSALKTFIPSNVTTLNTVPHVTVTPITKLFSLILHNCDFATVMKCNVNIYFPTVSGNPCERVSTEG